MTSLTGTTVAARYNIQRKLGAGSMAVVYLAHDTQHDRKVALKVLRPELAADIGADRFLTEIRTTANLQHPHILALFDSGRVDGTVYYVMPFVEGESLRQRLDREKQLPVDEAVRIAREVAGALDYAHRHDVIHRDVKPENILLQDGQALVGDFGIALAASKVSDTRMTETGMSLGTPMYMSPEQAMGERNLDARTDVYALGCVLFEMLAGEPPFSGPNAQAVVARVLTDQPRRLSALRRTVPPHVEDVVDRALEKLPADRLGSAREFADRLADPGTGSGQRRTAVPPRSSIVRHPLVIGLTTSAIALGAIALQLAERSRTPAPATSVRFGVELPADTRLAVYALTGANMAISPDGRTIVISVEGPNGIRRLYQRGIDELELRPIPGTDGASQPSISRDGRLVAFVATGRLMKVALDSSAPQPVTNVPVGDLAGHAWTPDGGIIYPDALGNLAVVKSFGAPELLTAIDSASGERQQQYPVVLADGEHVLGLRGFVWVNFKAFDACYAAFFIGETGSCLI